MGLWRTAVNTVRSGGRICTGALRGGGTALKTAAVGGTAGYVGWQTLVNDKPLARTASDMIIGSENAQKLGNSVDATIETVNTAAGAVRDVAHTASDTINSVTNSVTGAISGGSAESPANTTGVGNFIQGIMSGNGLGMIGDFFRNIGEGKVSGMSFAGLIGAAFLIFGRFGWLGKIAGALIGMTVLGNNLNMARLMGGSDPPLAQRGDMATAITPAQGQEAAMPAIRRGR